jgi:hypothetical protein
MNKNGTLLNPQAHGHDDDDRATADATVQATAFLQRMAGIRGISVDELKDAMSAARTREMNDITCAPMLNEGNARRRRLDVAAQHTKQDSIDGAFAREAITENMNRPSNGTVMSKRWQAPRGDGGRFHSAGGLAH